MEPEAQRQFEAELSWCIQQLGLNLTSKKMSERQAKDTEKALKVLQNPKAPLIKKRQVMRSSFGDYRAKMQEEEKKFKLESKLIAKPKPTSVSKFVKKSATLTDNSSKPCHDSSSKETHTFNPSDNSFRFNFSNNT